MKRKSNSYKEMLIRGLKCIPFILPIAFFFLSCKDSETIDKLGATILAIVNEDTIRVRDIEELVIMAHSKMRSDKLKTFDFKKLVNKKINDRLIVQEALALEMDQEEFVVDNLNKQLNRITVKSFLKNAYSYKPQIDSNEILETFKKYYPKYQVRTISIMTKEEADSLIQLIKNGAGMDSLAEKLSLDSRKIKGGLHTLKFYIDIENVIRDRVVKLKVGELSEPFRFRNVYAFMRLEKYIPPDTTHLPVFERKIRLMIGKEKKQKAWEIFLDSLQQVYSFTFDSTTVEKIKNDSSRLYTQDFLMGSDSLFFAHDDTFFVTENDFRRQISQYAMKSGKTSFDSISAMAEKALRADLLLKIASFKNGFDKMPEAQKEYQKVFDSTLVEYYIKDVVVARITFNRKEFEEYYDEHLEDFRENSEIIISTILAQSRDSAYQILSRLEDGANFSFIKKQFDPDTGISEEKMKWISTGSFPGKVQEGLEKQKKGYYSKPFKTKNGWLLFYLKDKRPGRIKTLNEADMTIRKIIFQKKFNELMDENLDILKKNSTIVLFDKNIEECFRITSKMQ